LLYKSIAEGSDDTLLSDIQGQIHHFLPLYLGGGNEASALVRAQGSARISEEAHGMLHELIDETSISQYMDTQDEVTLQFDSLKDHYKDDELKVLIGTMLTDSTIHYKETNLKLIASDSQENTQK
jgi:hypothetical protein